LSDTIYKILKYDWRDINDFMNPNESYYRIANAAIRMIDLKKDL